ncbi:flagellar brake protein [Pradoshia sp.]|uniref:flagellar brake protein n=1 Tax=Bacillaceae TaxID=186817 RepID=UPI0009E29659
MYKCKIADYTNEEVFIDYPINLDTNKLSYLQTGTELFVTFLAKDQHTYRFQTKVIRKHRENIPMLVLYYPGDSRLTKIQRGEFVRFERQLEERNKVAAD